MPVQILQQWATEPGSPVLTFGVPIQETQQPGSAFVVGIALPAGYAVVSVQDNAGTGNEYVQIPGAYISDNGSNHAADAWWATNTLGLGPTSGNSITVVITGGGATSQFAAGYTEVSDINSAIPVVVTQPVTATGGANFNGPSLAAGSAEAFYAVINSAVDGDAVTVASPWAIDFFTRDLNAGLSTAVTVGTGTQQAVFTRIETNAALGIE